ncbi:hypothetical protein [Actinomadura sp. NPDC049753]|uniref:hypothetical protein n=1 Tax=Actinomadura sp. NPDC049753 TaxID=3154739 RepID=UPI00344695B8
MRGPSAAYDADREDPEFWRRPLTVLQGAYAGSEAETLVCRALVNWEMPSSEETAQRVTRKLVEYGKAPNQRTFILSVARQQSEVWIQVWFRETPPAQLDAELDELAQSSPQILRWDSTDVRDLDQADMAEFLQDRQWWGHHQPFGRVITVVVGNAG